MDIQTFYVEDQSGVCINRNASKIRTSLQVAILNTNEEEPTATARYFSLLACFVAFLGQRLPITTRNCSKSTMSIPCSLPGWHIARYFARLHIGPAQILQGYRYKAPFFLYQPKMALDNRIP